MEVTARSLGFQSPRGERFVTSRETFRDVDFRGRKLLGGFSSEGSRFIGCRFDSAVIDSASFGAGRLMSEYRGCSFDSARLSMGPGGFARFVDCSFEKTNIDSWFCYNVELIDCTFSGRLRKVVFNGAVRSEDQPYVGRTVNRYEGNDFSRAELVGVSFRSGIDLDLQKLPTGDGYFTLDRAGLESLRPLVSRFHGSDASEAEFFLSLREEYMDEGQEKILVRVDDYPRSRRHVIRALRDALGTSSV
jgi:uncharacterized protein YjbI with pentapeptide repeats